MKTRFLFEVIVDSVPQWYEPDDVQNKNFRKQLYIDKDSFDIASHRNFTPNLFELHEFCQKNIDRWANSLPPILSGSSRRQITQEMALYWLSLHDSDVEWHKLIAYAEDLLFRTYENTPVTINLIISPQDVGGGDITDMAVHKFIDPIATSMQTFLKVDGSVNFVDYGQIDWSQIRDTTEYKFNPEFLQPFASALLEEQFSFHVTIKGEIIIMNHMGLLASYRKGRWHIYDVQTLKNCIGDIADSYRVGCNIFEVLLDLSYKRHGALLVYDPAWEVVNHVVNTESKLSQDSDDFRKMLTGSVKCISMENPNMSERKKRVMLELASMDGAVIFDNDNILSFGSMIETHPDAGGYAGARTTAFESSFRYGGRPFKVSSDGDISLRFGSAGETITFL